MTVELTFEKCNVQHLRIHKTDHLKTLVTPAHLMLRKVCV